MESYFFDKQIRTNSDSSLQSGLSDPDPQTAVSRFLETKAASLSAGQLEFARATIPASTHIAKNVAETFGAINGRCEGAHSIEYLSQLSLQQDP
ncbi:hypothetical protein [Stenotrophomonas sp.]|uniref:hypothetical protein n=1 Tax=Stenotrophomonas sp. TaxID=69392 RepID=UPI0028A6017B|nr:hypothetical protein [Stenotrophomonas sp.]